MNLPNLLIFHFMLLQKVTLLLKTSRDQYEITTIIYIPEMWYNFKVKTCYICYYIILYKDFNMIWSVYVLIICTLRPYHNPYFLQIIKNSFLIVKLKIVKFSNYKISLLYKNLYFLSWFNKCFIIFKKFFVLFQENVYLCNNFYLHIININMHMHVNEIKFDFKILYYRYLLIILYCYKYSWNK